MILERGKSDHSILVEEPWMTRLLCQEKMLVSWCSGFPYHPHGCQSLILPLPDPRVPACLTSPATSSLSRGRSPTPSPVPCSLCTAPRPTVGCSPAHGYVLFMSQFPQGCKFLEGRSYALLSLVSTLVSRRCLIDIFIMSKWGLRPDDPWQWRRRQGSIHNLIKSHKLHHWLCAMWSCFSSFTIILKNRINSLGKLFINHRSD